MRAHRQLAGLTIEHLADIASMHPTYLSDIERGRGNPTLAKLVALADALEMRVSELVAQAEADS